MIENLLAINDFPHLEMYPHYVRVCKYLTAKEAESNYLRESRFGLPRQTEAASSNKLEIGEKLSLIKYHLQFSAVNSQLKNHSKSVESGVKALRYLK